MSNPQAIIVSDLHIGSRYFLCGKFTRFLQTLPAASELVINGDVVDHFERPTHDTGLAVLDMLRKESESRTVVWVRGNHDRHYRLDNPCGIQFRDSYAFDKRLFVTHGDRFYKLMPHDRIFKTVFALFYRAYIKISAEPVHVAFFAKRFPHLYDVFRNRVAHNAARYARSERYDAITCGHVHYAEERNIDGVRYMNSGAWTEEPVHCLVIRENDISLCRADAPAAAGSAAA